MSTPPPPHDDLTYLEFPYPHPPTTHHPLYIDHPVSVQAIPQQQPLPSHYLSLFDHGQ